MASERPFLYPEDGALLRALGRSVRSVRPAGRAGTRFTGIERRRNPYGGSFPSEVVTLKAGRAAARQVFLKYEAPVPHTGHGYWGNVAYEAEVYRSLLAGTGVPPFLGHHRIGGASCLALGFIDKSVRLEISTAPSLVRSAIWLGAFHASFDRARRAQGGRLLHRYDAAYYLGWAERTVEYARPLLRRHPWLPAVAREFAAAAALLAAPPFTVVHGEFYPKNILIAGTEVHPVDWQSAALGRGEVDLASLTENWKPASLVTRCERAYARARWPGGAPADFPRVLAAARLYWAFRWLGDRPSFTRSPRYARYFPLLKAEARRLGIL